MYYYAFTLSKVRGEKSYEAYEEYLTEIEGRSDFKIPFKQYEENRGLHVHTMIVSKSRVAKKDVYLHKHGWSIDFRMLKSPDDIGKWVMYCYQDLYENVELKYKFPERQTEGAPPHAPESVESLSSDDVPTPQKYTYPSFDIRKACVQVVSDIIENI